MSIISYISIEIIIIRYRFFFFLTYKSFKKKKNVIYFSVCIYHTSGLQDNVNRLRVYISIYFEYQSIKQPLYVRFDFESPHGTPMGGQGQDGHIYNLYKFTNVFYIEWLFFFFSHIYLSLMATSRNFHLWALIYRFVSYIMGAARLQTSNFGVAKIIKHLRHGRH